MGSRPQTVADYEPFLTLYFEEEIMGEAYFLAMAEHFPEPHQCEALSLLSKIERCVAESVRPLLTRHGLTPRSDEDLHAIGTEKIEQYSGVSWLDYMTGITEKFPVYIEDFAALARLAPAEDQELLEPFTEHEVDGIDFAEREIAGDPDSTAVLARYIESF